MSDVEEEVISNGKGGGQKERKVMVAIDESESSHYALMWVLDNLVDTISKAPLVIFMAQLPPNPNVSFAATLGSARMFSPISASPDFVNSEKERQRKLASVCLEKAKGICASRGVIAETFTEVGDPRTAICDVVEKLNISMLVMGERGLGRIKRVILGSVSNYCVQNAKCPVLVVRKP